MSKAPWMVAGAAAVALAGVVFLTRPASGSTHPTPRPGITAGKVLPDFAIPKNPGAVDAYAAARRAAETLDGVYCHCDCSKHSGHRSLLTPRQHLAEVAFARHDRSHVTRQPARQLLQVGVV